jgi:hypothetical protein
MKNGLYAVDEGGGSRMLVNASVNLSDKCSQYKITIREFLVTSLATGIRRICCLAW